MSAGRNAGIVSRSLASLIDLAVVLGLMVGTYGAIVLVLLFVRVSDFTWPRVPWLFTVPMFLGMAIVYLAVCWAAFGRTVGQALMGLRVVRRRKSDGPTRQAEDVPLHLVQAVLRALACTFFPIGLGWVIISPDRASVQDLVLRTRVTYEVRG